MSSTVRAKITLDIELTSKSDLFDIVNMEATVRHSLVNSHQGYIIHDIKAIEVCARCGSKSIAHHSDHNIWYCKRCYKALTDPKTPY